MLKTRLEELNLAEAYYGFLALTLSALLIVAIGRFTNIDLVIEDYYYSPLLKTFI